jgi:3-hydroxyisobutyrate dehydrogenase-like beta-hydroxyacid dehydrogenase
MGPTVVVIAMGEMGSGIARRLKERGARVRTSLTGRSSASAARASSAGAEPFDDDRALLEGSDFMLSVVPPGTARDLARRLAPALQAVARKPVYVDCNAIAPQSAREVAAILAPTGCPFADGGIIGGPPKGEEAGPRIYISGPAAQGAAALARCGLDMRVLPGDVGIASAFKLSYAGFTKGVVALASEMILGATQAGIETELKREIASSQPQLLTWIQKRVPEMYHKSYRWVAEMEEISAYLEDVPGGGEIYAGMARLYRELADAAKTRGGKDNPVDALQAFLGPGKTG